MSFPFQKIYGSPKSFRVQKILIAAKIGNKDVSVLDQRPPHNKFPLGVVGILICFLNLIVFAVKQKYFHLSDCFLRVLDKRCTIQ